MVSKVAEVLERQAQVALQAGREPNPRICVWCANRTHEACEAWCRPEGKFRYLAPDTRPAWEPPPELPPLREMVEWPAAERLAMLWLVVYYRCIEASSAGGS